MFRCKDVYAHKRRVIMHADRMLREPLSFDPGLQNAVVLAGAVPKGSHIVTKNTSGCKGWVERRAQGRW
jgi:hypothetical protein